MGGYEVRVLQDVITLVSTVLISCGEIHELREALAILSLMLDKARRGSRQDPRDVITVYELVEDARRVLESSGCLEAYRLEEVVSLLRSIYWDIL